MQSLVSTDYSETFQNEFVKNVHWCIKWQMSIPAWSHIVHIRSNAVAVHNMNCKLEQDVNEASGLVITSSSELKQANHCKSV